MQQIEEIEANQQTEEVYDTRTFIIDKGQEPMRIDKWLQIRTENITRNKIQQSIDAGFLSVNGKIVKSNYRVKPGDELVMIQYVNPEYTELKPENLNLNVVYEDADLMVVNKPANMVVHPGVGNYTGTLLNGFVYHLMQQNPNLTEDELPRFGLVHRIDKNTTGLLVLAKTPTAAAHLAKQFFNHTVKRKYVALVWGNIEQEEGTITGNIARHTQNRKMFTVYEEPEIGKHAITHYKVLQRFYYTTLVECVLETGRTHQIRVHMKHIGHNLFNDWEYGGDRILKGTVYSKYKQFVDNCFEICPRCALHAKTLGFIHPTTGEEMIFEAPLPQDITNVVAKWETYSTAKKLDTES
jgi:23S rRNA pseudouridine1911/1915/1917 synthase